jgi:peptide/nickel transport system substrate-binding protein
MQNQAFIDLPYIPTGQLFTPEAYHSNLQGMLTGVPPFWNIRRVA